VTATAGAEQVDDVLADAADLGAVAVGPGHHHVVQRRQLCLQDPVGDRGDGKPLVVQAARVQGPPLGVGAVGALDPVPDRHVHVELRVAVAGQVVQEQAGDQAVAVAPLPRPGGMVPGAGVGGVLLQPGDGFAGGVHRRGFDLIGAVVERGGLVLVTALAGLARRDPEDSWVEVRYPLTRGQEHGDRDEWPWLPGWVAAECGPDEWGICVQAPELAIQHEGETWYPTCFRDSSEIRLPEAPFMNVSAADVASPRSVAAYAVAPLALAVVVDRVVAVIRRHVLADQEPSAWITVSRAVATAGKATGLVLLYCLRFALAAPETARGLRRIVLDAAPRPALQEKPAPEAIEPPRTKKAVLLALYRAHPDYGDRSKASRVAAELAAPAGLQAGTARSYLYAELDSGTS
jgi:hypothetical protein